MKAKQYPKIVQDWKKTMFVDGRIMIDWEVEISQFNQKMLKLDTFKMYIKIKNELMENYFMGRISFKNCTWETIFIDKSQRQIF